MGEFILRDRDFLLLKESTAEVSTFATPLLNTFVRATIRLVNVSSGAATSLVVVNREFTSDMEAFPLLLNFSGIGLRHGEFLPEKSRGSIIIDNTDNSFGNRRRFTDLLEDYSVIEQQVSLGVAQLAVGDEDIQAADFVEIYRGVCTEVNDSKGKCRLSLSTNLIPARVTTRSIDSDVFPNAPVRSLGRHLPLIFSDDDEYIQVEPLQVTEMYDDSGENKIDYAYATTFADQYLPGDASDDIKVYYEDQNRNFQEVTFVSDPDTPILDFPPTSPGGSDVGSYADVWEELSELAYKLKAGEGGIEAGHVIVGCDWVLAGHHTDDTASFTAKGWSESNGFPLNTLTSDTIGLNETAKFTESTISGSGIDITTFHFAFPRPLVVPEGGSVFISMSQPKDPAADFLPLRYDGPGGSLSSFEEYTLLDLDGYRTDFRRQVKTSGRHHLAVYALGMDETQNACATGDLQNGLGYSTFTLRMRDQDNVPNLGASRWLCAQQGLRDDSSGTITGAANQRLKYPVTQARVLLMDWDGTDWLETTFDVTKFQTTHYEAYNSAGTYTMKTSGATQGRKTVENVLEEICRNGAARIVAYGSTGTKYLGCYAHGTALSSSGTITDEDLRYIGFQIGGADTVLNDMRALYSRNIETTTESLLAEGGLNNYSAIMDSTQETLQVSSSLLAQSRSRWGIRDIANATYNFVNDATTMNSVISLLFMRFNSPEWILQIGLPFYTFSDIEPMDELTISSTRLPRYEGTSFSRLADTTSGNYLTTTVEYVFQVEGVGYEYSKEEGMEIILSLRRRDPADA